MRTIEVEPGTSVEVHVNRVSGALGRGTMLLVHGLGVHAESRYMRWSATQALEREWNVVRLNLRNCDGTEDDPVVPIESFELYQTPAGHPVRCEYSLSSGHVGFGHRGEPRY